MNQVIFGNVIRTTEPEITAEKPLALKAGVTMGTTPQSYVTRAGLNELPSGSLLLAPPTITLWSAGNHKDGQIKTTVATYYKDDTKSLEQRFDWNTDLSVLRIELKDDLNGLWVQRNYTWTNGIPTITETTITAWTILTA